MLATKPSASQIFCASYVLQYLTQWCLAEAISCKLLHEDGTLENEEIKGLLKLLRKLVKSSGVLPECYKLRGVECGFGLAEKGGGFGDVFEGRYREQKICVKAIRIFGDRNKEKALKVS